MSGTVRFRSAASGVVAAAVTFVALLASPAPMASPAIPSRHPVVATHAPHSPLAHWLAYSRTRQPAIQVNPPVTPDLGNGPADIRLRAVAVAAAARAKTPHPAGVRLAQVRAPPVTGH